MSTTWKEPQVPRHAVQMIVVDMQSNCLMLHRSPNVRSAPNCWSFPSGLHDIGETIEQTIKKELQEEFGLEPKRWAQIATYENIAGDEGDGPQYHWVISLFVVLVEDCHEAVNKEPDKHDKFRVFPYVEFHLATFWVEHQFHPSFHNEFSRYRGVLANMCSNITGSALMPYGWTQGVHSEGRRLLEAAAAAYLEIPSIVTERLKDIRDQYHRELDK